jgi:predicted RNase H-like nuclease (RuvC/YqgF family)
MGNAKILTCLITICILGIPWVTPAFAMQSLADAARREAERRERIERLGIEEKVIEGNGTCSSLKGNVSVFTPSNANPEAGIQASHDPENRSSLSQYRTKLQKLDKGIREGEVRLEKLRDQLDSLRRKSLEIGNFKGFSRNEESRDRVEVQIEELQADLKLLRKERRELYDSGRKDGFLPGELEGKGIIP